MALRTVGLPGAPAGAKVVALSDGSYVAAWSKTTGDLNLSFQRFDAGGRATGPVTVVYSNVAAGLGGPTLGAFDIEALYDGRFALAFANGSFGRFGGATESVTVNVYGADGLVSSSTLPVSARPSEEHGPGGAASPELVAHSGGGFILVSEVYGAADPTRNPSYRVTTHDSAGQVTASSTSVQRPDAVLAALPGGSEEHVFDWGNVQAYSHTATELDGQGRLLKVLYEADDGSSWFRAHDPSNAGIWAIRVAEYDTAGKLFAWTVIYDDGQRELYAFDTANTRAWSRLVERYDPQGRLSVQAAANDDGTAWERHIDTANQHPWAYYIDNYNQGSLLNHTYYRDDGSVFV